ncbi:MAG: hypothetical protein ACYTJ0_04845 [Planctomycetota bacterium]
MIARLAARVAAAAILVVLIAWACLVQWSASGAAAGRQAHVGSWPRSRPVHDVELAVGTGVTVVRSRRYCDGERPQPAFYFEVVGHPPIEDWLPAWAHPRSVRPEGHDPCGRVVEEIAGGWPFRALRCSALLGPRGAEPHEGPAGGLRLERPGLAVAALPVVPIWPGAALNLLVYAAALGVAITTLRLTRSAVRRRRGRCPACGFRLYGDVAGCPECGRGMAPAPPSGPNDEQIA